MFSTKDIAASDDRMRREVVAPPAVRAVLLATSIASFAALATYAVARGVSGDLIVNGPAGSSAVPVGAVVVATAVAGLGAWGLADLAARTRRPRTVLVGLIALGLAVSSVPPVRGASTSSSAAWLLLMHLVVAVPLVGVAWRLIRRSP